VDVIVAVSTLVAALLAVPRMVWSWISRWRAARRGFPMMTRRQLVAWAVVAGVEPRWWESQRRLRGRIRDQIMTRRKR
jgi:hypothetical protein